LNCKVLPEPLDPESSVLAYLTKEGIKPSVSQGLKAVRQGGLKINNVKVTEETLAWKHHPPINESVYVLKVGKKEYHALLLK
jgi:tyrosyl-tRNA synthetase